MTLTVEKDPEVFINIDKDIIVERLELINNFKDPIFLLDADLINFEKFIIEVHRQHETNTIDELIIIFPDVNKETAAQIANYFHTEEEQLKEMEELDSINFMFSIKQEVIKEFIQPYFKTPDDIKNVFKFINERDIPVLLDFDNYEPEGILD